MLLEKIKERQALREKLLSALYDYYFNNNGAQYRTTRDELENAPEERLAYDYLIEKRLVEVEKQGNQLIHFRITAHGIDVFENEFLKSV